MNKFTTDIVSVLAKNGFVVEFGDADGEPLQMQYIKHDKIPHFRLTFRMWNDAHFQIEVSGRGVANPRQVDYMDGSGKVYNSKKSITNLKSRLVRISKNEQERLDYSNLKKEQAVEYKNRIVNYLAGYNESRFPNHNIVFDEIDLDDAYKSLTCYYRGHEFQLRIENGTVYSIQSLLNQPTQHLSVEKLVKIIDVIVGE